MLFRSVRPSRSLASLIKPAEAGGRKSAIGVGVPARIVVACSDAGRKPEDQLAAPFGGMPRGSGKTTNSGRFLLALPSAYVIQLPELGNPGRMNPVFCMNVAGPCTFDFDISEWTKAMSSTHLAVCGNRSLTHFPHLPCCFHPQGLGMTVPGLLWNSSTFSPGSHFSPAWRINRVVVERVALARSSGHEQLNDPFRLRRVMESSVELGTLLRFGVTSQHACKRDAAQSP